MRMMRLHAERRYKGDTLTQEVRIVPTHVVALEEDPGTKRTVITTSYGGLFLVVESTSAVEGEWYSALLGGR